MLCLLHIITLYHAPHLDVEGRLFRSIRSKIALNAHTDLQCCAADSEAPLLLAPHSMLQCCEWRPWWWSRGCWQSFAAVSTDLPWPMSASSCSPYSAREERAQKLVCKEFKLAVFDQNSVAAALCRICIPGWTNFDVESLAVIQSAMYAFRHAFFVLLQISLFSLLAASSAYVDPSSPECQNLHVILKTRLLCVHWNKSSPCGLPSGFKTSSFKVGENS